MLARTWLIALSIVGSASAAHADVPRFGVMTDLGVPDGAVASLVYRPLRGVRLHAGGGHNYVSPGVRGGLTLVPFSSWITPTVTFDYGRYFEGDANPLARMISGDASFSAAALERVGYDYANAHVGLELGRKRATFYLHAGMSRITGNIRNLNSLGDMSESGTTVTFVEDPRLEMWTVSARVGLIVYLVQ